MATNNKKKKAAAAVAAAALLLLGGTFAWQSISQMALNEASDVINPGGRLHDDFNGTNKDVYVENFAEDDIFARVRLEEYFEITMNKGSGDAERTETIVGEKTVVLDEEGNPVLDENGNKVFKTNYEVFKAYNSDGIMNAATDTDGISYWQWKTGGSKAFMPTFNKNKDSLAADVNGTYNGNDGVVTDAADDDRYSDYVEYSNNEAVTKDAVYDADSNDAEDEGVTKVSEEHFAKNTLNAALISMDEWFALDPAERKGYWVYDTDGWVYWSGPIPQGEATGLLLDGIELNQVMDDSWYYAINVVGQFITADDLGSPEDNDGQGSGFYKQDEGPAPSDNALKLLEALGVNITGEESEEEEFVDEGTLEGINLSLYSNNENIKVSEKSNTLLVKPVYGWNKVYVNVAFGDLDLILANTTQAIYEWDEASETYVKHEEGVVDIEYYEDGLDLFLSENAVGRYKLTASYDDNGTVYNGELEFTIKVETEEEEPGTGGDDPGTGGDDPTGIPFATTDDLSGTPYAILTKSATDSDKYEMTFVRSYSDLTDGNYTYNDKTVERVYIVPEDGLSGPDWIWDLWEDYGYESYGYKISNVEFANTIAPTDTFGWFRNFDFLESITFGSNFSGENLENMNSMFSGGYYSVLKSVDMSEVDCGGKLIDVSDMFRDQNNLEVIKLPKNVKVANLASTFYQCNALTTIEGLETWDMSSCEDMSYAFWCCKALESLDVDSWDTSSVTDTEGTFGAMSELTYIDLSSFDMSKVTNMAEMFRSCVKLETIEGADKWDVSRVTNMYQLFMECGNLTLNCENWNVDNVTNYEGFSSTDFSDSATITTITQPTWK